MASPSFSSDVSDVNRTRWFRFVALLVGAWLPLLAGEPGLVHACPSHGSTDAGHHGSLPDAPAHGAHHEAPADTEQHGCNCITGCVSSASIAAPTIDAVLVVAVTRVDADSPRHVESVHRSAPEHARPFTTGPPRV
jgi:hypothetical protein